MEQRSEFRIVYPLPARPLTLIAGGDYSTLEVSERALRLDNRRAPRVLSPGERMAGSVMLAHRAAHAFEGVVLRVEERSTVVILDERFRIDLEVIYREQHYLHSKFPDWR